MVGQVSTGMGDTLCLPSLNNISCNDPLICINPNFGAESLPKITRDFLDYPGILSTNHFSSTRPPSMAGAKR